MKNEEFATAVRIFLVILCLLYQIIRNFAPMTNRTRRMPAEWEPQSCVQLTWPHKDTDWAPMLDEITAVYEVMAREISKREGLLVVAPPDFAKSIVNCQLSIVNCQLSIVNSNDTWARDHGFITVEEASGLVLLDFKFNGWGEKFEAALDNAINRQLYDQGLLKGSYEPHLDFVLEGGSIESDGKGTIFTTACCLLAPHRNQPLTQAEIEERLKQWLGAERVVWLNYGSLMGDDTDGHIDTLVRICPDDTLLYVGCDDPDDPQYEELHLMEAQLRTFRTLQGQPYRLLRLPMPRPIYESDFNAEGKHDRLPATYANFLVINGAVLCPTYDQPDLDAEALRLIAQAFPGREIVPIDCRAVIRQHGSLHCCTMQFPLI